MSELILTGSPSTMLAALSAKAGLAEQTYIATVRAACFPRGRCSDEELLAFLMVAARYGLDPVTREIYPMPKRDGGYQPVVSVDGWIRVVNEQPSFDGLEFTFADDARGELKSCTCTIWRKDRTHPTTITEYYDECKRSTDPWKQMKRRMLRHKALKEAARVAFGFAGITDEDEGRDIAQKAAIPSRDDAKEEVIDAECERPAPPAPAAAPRPPWAKPPQDEQPAPAAPRPASPATPAPAPSPQPLASPELVAQLVETANALGMEAAHREGACLRRGRGAKRFEELTADDAADMLSRMRGLLDAKRAAELGLSAENVDQARGPVRETEAAAPAGTPEDDVPF